MSNSENPIDLRKASLVELVRIMPGMYIGGTDHKALHHWFFEAVEHAIAEYECGGATQIEIVIANEVMISDNGDGFLWQCFEAANLPQEKMQTVWKENAKKSRYQIRFNLGIISVNALSSKFTIQAKRDGYLWQQHYEQGEPVSDLDMIRKLQDGEPTGTTRIFAPDFTIFQENLLDHELIWGRLREYAFLFPNLTITFHDKRSSIDHEREVFHYPEGVSDFIVFINQEIKTLHPALIIRKEMELESKDDPKIKYPFKVEIAMQFTDIADYRMLSFVNTVEIIDGGKHILGLIAGYSRVLDEYLQNVPNAGDGRRFTLSDKLNGFTAVVSLWHPAPQFEGAAKRKLINPELFEAVGRVVKEAFETFATQNPEYIQAIVQNCVKNRAMRLQRHYGDEPTIT